MKKRADDDPKPWQVGGREADTSLPVGPTVADAIGDLPNLDRFAALRESDHVRLSDSHFAAMEIKPSAYARRLRYDDDHVGYPRAWDRKLLTASARTTHTAESVERFEMIAPGDSDEISRLYRLDPDGLCSTLRAGTGYERGSFMAPRPIHPTRPRVISPREAARLHSFPDWFRFHVTKWHAFRQIGNSLPPLLARAVGLEIAFALGVAPARPSARLSLGDPALLSYDTTEAAGHFAVELADVPSHKLRWRKRRSSSADSARLAA